GASVINEGFSGTTNIQLNSTITYRPFNAGPDAITIVYNDSTSVSDLAADSTSNLITLPEYTPAGNEGYYDVFYGVSSDDDDTDGNDNLTQTQFAVIDEYYSKARWDFANRRGARTNAYTAGGGGPIEMITGFTIPKGIGYQIDSAIFYVSVRTAEGPLAGETVEVYLYEWNDIDTSGGTSNDELTILGLAFQEFGAEETATEAWLRLPFIDIETFEEAPIELTGDNKTYFLGVRYRGDRVLFIGFDEGLDRRALNELQNSQGQLTDAELGYFFVTEWIDDLIPNVNNGGIFTDLSAPLSTAFTISEVVSDVKEVLAENAFELQMYPNPVSEELTTTFNLTENSAYVIYQIFDVQGKLIFSQRNNGLVQKDNAIFNVSKLPVGQYYLKVVTDKGFTSKSFTVQR
ncbi:MAG: T9SS type A sorting domain-containing protein, partial [Saprospiraceae bacterium]|nr:T9SS type A sorting domain-containing protein [Saprospiraceae bacterium]